MEFEKKVMKLSELEQLGFDKKYLYSLTRLPKQDFCWRQNPLKENSQYLFDTDRLQKYLDSQSRLQSRISRERKNVEVVGSVGRRSRTGGVHINPRKQFI